MSGYVLAGIVTYNPNIALLEKNVLAAAGQADGIVIVDNGSGNVGEIEILCKTYRVLLVKNRKNEGIARAMNQIFQTAARKGYRWILTLDQDSILPEGFVECARKVQEEKKETGIIAPRVYDTNMNIFLRAGNAEYDSYADACISSGSFISLEMYQKIGGFDDMLFIDMVDVDFCIRARLAGYKILILHNFVLKHSIGAGKLKRLFGVEVLVTQHSAERKYYIVRNRILCARRFAGVRNTYKSYAALYVVYLIVSTIMYEKQKYRKCCCILKGVVAGITMKRSLVMQIMQRDCFREN